MLVEESGLRILTDPGMYTVEAHTQVSNIDVILITHEHQDHLHIESLKTILTNNPSAQIVTNTDVAAIITAGNIATSVHVVDNSNQISIKGVVLESIGNDHAPIYPPIIASVQNTGYIIANHFFYPGDALTIPAKPIEVLALPIAGPWLKISEAVDYAKTVNPKTCFPVHDGGLTMTIPYHRTAERVLGLTDIKFQILELGVENQL